MPTLLQLLTYNCSYNCSYEENEFSFMKADKAKITDKPLKNKALKFFEIIRMLMEL